MEDIEFALKILKENKNKVYLRSVLIHTICLHILQCENGGRVQIECKLI